MQDAHVLLPDALVVLAIVIASRLGDFCSEATNRRLTYLVALLSSTAAGVWFAIQSVDSHQYYFFSRMIVIDSFASVMKAVVSLGFAASLVACAGTIGAIIPPSMTMIVYGSMANVSIGGLFMGGIIPGILIGIGLMIVIRIYSFAPAFPELRRTSGKFDVRRVGREEVIAALTCALERGLEERQRAGYADGCD